MADHRDFKKVLGEKAKWELQKDAVYCFKQILETSPPKNSNCTATYLPSHKSWMVRESQETPCCQHGLVMILKLFTLM